MDLQKQSIMIVRYILRLNLFNKRLDYNANGNRWSTLEELDKVVLDKLSSLAISMIFN